MILVTGGTGLVGSHLLYHLLLNGQQSVRAIYRSENTLKKVEKVFSYYTSDYKELFNKIEWVPGSINDIPSLEIAFTGIRVVYHCAALVSFDPNDYIKMRKVNIEGSVNIVNLSISNSIDKLCFVSSIATLEKKNGNKFIAEESLWNSSSYKSGYSITKHGAEMEIWRASQEGIDVVIVNPGVILGPGFWNNGTGKLFSNIYSGFKYFTKGVTGFVGVQDVVKVMIKLVQSDVKNKRFLLISENESFEDVFNTIADHLKVKRPHIEVSKFMSETGWKLDSIKSFILRKPVALSKYSARASQNKKYYSSQKIKTEINYIFEPLDKTIQNTCINYLKDH